jgi:hypothetical protein
VPTDDGSPLAGQAALDNHVEVQGRGGPSDTTGYR